jgi:hypothetical protein
MGCIGGGGSFPACRRSNVACFMPCEISPLAMRDDMYLNCAAVIGGGVGLTSGNGVSQDAARYVIGRNSWPETEEVDPYLAAEVLRFGGFHCGVAAPFQ